MTMQKMAGLFEWLAVQALGLGLRFFKGFETRPDPGPSEPPGADGMGQQLCQQFFKSQHQ